MSSLLARTSCWLGAALLLHAVPAWAADVYVSFDADGIARFAPTAIDDSYRLLFRDMSSGARGARRSAEPTPEIRKALQLAADRHKLDYGLLHAVAEAESGFDTEAVSPKGAVGLMQLMPATASQYGVPGSHATLQSNLRKLDLNVDAGSRYLRALMDRYDGNLELTLAAYNAGEGAVQRAGNRIPDYEETRNYVRRIMAAYRPGALTSVASSAPPVTSAPPAIAANQSTGPAMWTLQGNTKEVRQFEQGFMVVPPRKR
ncbi:lytic transglycosylase domain-containing protein [Achromobacter seleniivolatilans]|uniref:Lytic transglycosylase domain-containing protein n=1 Tax=Achromobacter seleniivolatilans TaxID=3047478 RepID=A0ABY9LW48_9BURK|nr:lytic transglycosylase domain-containing protein [Achromobacter sp. R39]WMD19001.1 lytic transglycosylase domain-containing protein [Achromobacter sp. R39]